jgi:hypothetical protein
VRKVNPHSYVARFRLQNTANMPGYLVQAQCQCELTALYYAAGWLVSKHYSSILQPRRVYYRSDAPAGEHTSLLRRL